MDLFPMNKSNEWNCQFCCFPDMVINLSGTLKFKEKGRCVIKLILREKNKCLALGSFSDSDIKGLIAATCRMVVT